MWKNYIAILGSATIVIASTIIWHLHGSNHVDHPNMSQNGQSATFEVYQDMIPGLPAFSFIYPANLSILQSDVSIERKDTPDRENNILHIKFTNGESDNVYISLIFSTDGNSDISRDALLIAAEQDFGKDLSNKRHSSFMTRSGTAIAIKPSQESIVTYYYLIIGDKMVYLITLSKDQVLSDSIVTSLANL